MEEFVYYDLLFDIYEQLLNDKSKEFFKLYYEENLTLQEIADNYHVSKSYVGSVLKKTEKKLDELEANLKIYENRSKLADLLKLNDIEKIKKGINKILD
ncbi:MAG TPA: DNA-binding protein [Candidatus Onthocola stercorigallinarum]|nr:DNA-binding protein [Candidatus Onthocola stercorigallinarum]